MFVQATAIEEHPAYTSKRGTRRPPLVVLRDVGFEEDSPFEDAIEELLHDFSASERMQLSWKLRREAATAILQ